MILSEVRIKGFRNFKDSTIRLMEKTLIFGENEVGKSNFLYALRILFDKSISPSSLEPNDSDFYAREPTNEFVITAKFEQVFEDCVVAKFREHISEDGVLYVGYKAERNKETNQKAFSILVGRSLDYLVEVEALRFYIRVLNLEFIGSQRDLASFIRKERRSLIQDAKAIRTEEEVNADNLTIKEVEENLVSINSAVSDLSYMNKSISSINEELRKLSIVHADQEVVFDTGVSDPSNYVDNLSIATKIGENPLAFGGDGRRNQIHLSLWAARYKNLAPEGQEPLEVTIFCIEEPEAHLHPHQQRKLASYLADSLKGQVIITTHSAQIISQFPPMTLVRLYESPEGSTAACVSDSNILQKAFIDFGHRMNALPAAAFFSNVVLLVEGPSEVLFYQALSEALDIDLDRLNISVLMVDGIGFAPYISLYKSLHIKCVVRTDNDIFKIPGREEHRFAGIQRGVSLYRDFYQEDLLVEQALADHEVQLQGFNELPPDGRYSASALAISDALERTDIFIADHDLENDLHQSALNEALTQYFEEADDADLVQRMQKRKATFMFDFLRKHAESLASLADDKLAKPILRSRDFVEPAT